MTNIEILERDIARLKDLISLAWRDLAETAMSSRERRDIRADMTFRAQALRGLLANLDTALLHEREEADRRAKRNRRPVAKLRLLDAA